MGTKRKKSKQNCMQHAGMLLPQWACSSSSPTVHPDLDCRVPLEPSNHCHLIHPKKTFIYVSLRRLYSIIDLNKNLYHRKTKNFFIIKGTQRYNNKKGYKYIQEWFTEDSYRQVTTHHMYKYNNKFLDTKCIMWIVFHGGHHSSLFALHIRVKILMIKSLKSITKLNGFFHEYGK